MKSCKDHDHIQSPKVTRNYSFHRATKTNTLSWPAYDNKPLETDQKNTSQQSRWVVHSHEPRSTLYAWQFSKTTKYKIWISNKQTSEIKIMLSSMSLNLLPLHQSVAINRINSFEIFENCTIKSTKRSVFQDYRTCWYLKPFKLRHWSS